MTAPIDYELLHTRLLASLQQVAEASETNSFDWQWQVLTVFQRYCEAAGVEPRLRAPLARMQMETYARIRRQEFPETGGPSAGDPVHVSQPLAIACAAVTELRRRGAYAKISEAAAYVSETMGIDAERIMKKRNDISRRQAGRDYRDAYDQMVRAMRSWDSFDRLAAYRGLTGKDL